MHHILLRRSWSSSQATKHARLYYQRSGDSLPVNSGSKYLLSHHKWRNVGELQVDKHRTIQLRPFGVSFTRNFSSGSSSSSSDPAGGDNKNNNKEKDASKTTPASGAEKEEVQVEFEEPGPLKKLFLEKFYVWGFIPNFMAEILANFRQLTFYLKRNGKEPKEILELHGFNDEEDFLLGCTVAYTRISQAFTKGEPVFATLYSDMVDPVLGSSFDAQLAWHKANGRVPKLRVGEVKAKLLHMERGVPINMVKLDDWAAQAKEIKDKGAEFVFEDIVPTYLYAYVLFESNEHFEWIPSGDTQKVNEEPTLVPRKHYAIFTASIPLGVATGKEADHVEFQFREFW